MTLDARASDLLAMLDRVGAPPMSEQSVEIARRNYHKLLFAYREEPEAVASAATLQIARRELEGGPLDSRLYKPLSRVSESLPVLLWLHGGGWTVGDLAGYDSLCRSLCNASGCAVLALAYRLAPEHRFPAAIDDAWHALRWLAKHGASHGLNTERMAVGGDSAGGNLAAVLAHLARDACGPELRLQVLLYPATDQLSERPSHARYANGFFLNGETLRWFQHNYLAAESDYLDWRASPLRAPKFDGLPPALVLTAQYDPLADDGLAYVGALTAAGVATNHLHYPGMIHGFASMPKVFPAARQAVGDIGQALRKALFEDVGSVAC